MELASSGDADVFCNGATGTKVLSDMPTVQACYEQANTDADCDMAFGAVYALQANDPTDTTRAERCLCVYTTCSGPWHATDAIFARYGLAS